MTARELLGPLANRPNVHLGLDRTTCAARQTTLSMPPDVGYHLQKVHPAPTDDPSSLQTHGYISTEDSPQNHDSQSICQKMPIVDAVTQFGGNDDSQWKKIA